MLNKKYALITVSVHLINRKGLGIEDGAIYHIYIYMWYPTIGGAKITKITMEEYTIISSML